jgi:hypothetical protein
MANTIAWSNGTVTYSSSIVNPAFLKWPLALLVFDPIISTHHSRYATKSGSSLTLYHLQFRLIRFFNSAKNSSIGFRSGEYGGR